MLACDRMRYLTLTHENVIPDYASRTQAGWTGILDKLAVAIGWRQCGCRYILA